MLSSSRRFTAFAFLFYLVLAVVMTWPLIWRLSSAVPMGTHDIWQNYWNFWWWKRALLEIGQSPYHTDMIFHPVFRDAPAPLGCHTHSPANIIWTMPVNALFGVSAALNLAVFAGFVLAGFGAWLLTREYTPSRAGAILGGIVYAYFPQHVEQSLEHLNLASIHGLPLFLWALVRVIRHGGAGRSALCGALFALNALFSWHLGLIAVALGIPLAIFELVKGDRRLLAVLGNLGAAAVLALALVGPSLWALVDASASGEAVLRKAPVDKPIDLLFLLIPHSGHPLWGAAVADIHDAFRSYPSVGFVGYIGIAALSLALLSPLADRARRTPAGAHAESRSAGVRPIRHATWLWVGLFVFFLLLALGATLKIAGQDVDWLPMPYRWLQEIPIFGIVRVPNRFLPPAMLALSVLVALGAGAIALLLPARFKSLFVAGAGLLLLVDFMWIPYPMRPVPRPEWLAELDRFPRDTIVLDIPSGHRARAAEDMLLQTWHGRPIASGYTATPLRRVEELLERYPVLRRILERYPPEKAKTGPPLSAAIRELGIGVVVLHHDRSVSRILQRRKEIARTYPNAIYRKRIENPEVGTEDATLRAIREELVREFGEPVARHGDEVEIFVVR